jgi:Ca-activated chloride channel family protein
MALSDERNLFTLRRPLRRGFLGVAILSSIAGSFVAVARATDDHVPVSITPIPRRPTQRQALGPSAIRLDVNLVLIPVLVTDIYDRPIRGLSKDNFRLFEGAAEQQISHFFRQDAPISIGIVVDASHSMTPRMDATRQAVSEFVHQSSSGDEFFLVQFSDHPDELCDFTTDPAAIEHEADGIRTGGWTSLYDAMYLGIRKMKHAKYSRKVLLVFSDGGDNHSRYSRNELSSLIKEADVRVFSISIIDGAASLQRLSEESGGRLVRIKNLTELPDIAANLSEEIHSEYVLGYSPSDDQSDGRYRNVKVELVPPAGQQRLRTSWKHGYYAPTQ